MDVKRSETFMALAKKKLAIQQAIETAKKGTDNPYFKSKYADLNEVVSTIKDAMEKAKSFLLIEQYPGVIYLEEKPMVEVTTRLVEVDSGEWEEIKIIAKPDKDTPQSIGSTITYLRRYSLMPMLGVVPEDDDGNAASGSDKQGSKPAQQGASKPPLAANQETGTATIGGDPKRYAALMARCKEKKLSREIVEKYIKIKYKADSIKALTIPQFLELMAVAASSPDDITFEVAVPEGGTV